MCVGVHAIRCVMCVRFCVHAVCEGAFDFHPDRSLLVGTRVKCLEPGTVDIPL